MVKIYVHAMTFFPPSHVYVRRVKLVPVAHIGMDSAVRGPMKVYGTFDGDVPNNHKLAFYASLLCQRVFAYL